MVLYTSDPAGKKKAQVIATNMLALEWNYGALIYGVMVQSFFVNSLARRQE